MEAKIEYLKKRAELLNDQLTQVQNNDEATKDIDLANWAAQQNIGVVVDEVGNTTNAELYFIRKALRRYEEGNYGLCQGCGKQIEAKRLEVAPETDHCTRCSLQFV